MENFRDFLNEELKDPELKAKYEALEPEYNIISSLIEARKAQNLTQKDLPMDTPHV